MFLTYTDFVAKIYPLVGEQIYPRVKNTDPKRGWAGPDTLPPAIKDITRKNELRGTEVCTGGVSGGSCWESSDPRPYTNDHETPVLEGLDKILEDIFPTITYLQYRKLERAAKVSIGTREEMEYYGNETHYSYMRVNLGDLYMALIECGVIEG